MKKITHLLALALVGVTAPALSAQEWEKRDGGVRKEAVLLPDSTDDTGVYLVIGCDGWLSLTYAKPFLLGLDPAEDPQVRVRGADGFIGPLVVAHQSGNFRAYLHTRTSEEPMHRAHLLDNMRQGTALAVHFIDGASVSRIDYEVDLAGFSDQWNSMEACEGSLLAPQAPLPSPPGSLSTPRRPLPSLLRHLRISRGKVHERGP